MALTSLHRYVARRFRDSRLQRILEYHCVFLGTSPFEAPAIYSLMSTLDFKSGVYFPKHGIYSLIESMVQISQEYDVTFRTDTAVTSINVADGRASGVQLADGSHITADVVISAADLHFTETSLLPPHAQSFPESYWRKKQPGPSALLVSFGIRGKLTGLEHHNLYFVDDWQQNFANIYSAKTVPDNPSIYICNPSKTDPSAAPTDHENIFMLVPLPAGVPLSSSEAERLTDHCIALLARLANAPDITERIVTRNINTPQDFDTQFHAWQLNALGGMSHTLRQSAFWRTPGRSKKVSNLYYVGAGTNPGIGLPMCLMSAQIAYKNVHGIRDNRPLSSVTKAVSL